MNLKINRVPTLFMNKIFSRFNEDAKNSFFATSSFLPYNFICSLYALTKKKLYGTYMSKLYVKYRGHIIVKYMSHICILNVNEVEDI